MHGFVPDQPPLPFYESGDGAPVLLIHGRLNDPQLWEAAAVPLSRRFRTIRPDLRTRGRVPDRTAELHALINWLNLSRVHLVTHGAGWSWAAALAAQEPHRVASLTVVDPVIPRVEQNNAVQEAWHLEMLLQWLSASHGSVVRRPEHATALAAVIAQQTHAQMSTTAGLPGGPDCPAGSDMPALTGIVCPLLALVGRDAPAESKSLVGSVFGQVRQARISLVPGANRHSPVEAPGALADLISRYLDSVV